MIRRILIKPNQALMVQMGMNKKEQTRDSSRGWVERVISASVRYIVVLGPLIRSDIHKLATYLQK